MDFITKIKKHLPDKTEKLIIGVSGGVDSMVLLDVLNKTGYKLIVCHVNYNLRKNSLKDYVLIKEYCNKNKIQLEYFDVKQKSSGNTQAEARKIRYKFYKQISNQENTDTVLLGHHKDDSIETFLLQKQRNIIVEHYGLRYSREVLSMNILRPMLGVAKSEVLGYAKRHDIKWNEDQSNAQNIYERNKIRNTILKESSFLKRKLIILEMVLWNKKTKALFKACEKQSAQNIIDNKMSGELFNLPKSHYTIIIYSYLKTNRYPVSRINKKIISEIISFSQKTRKPSATLDLARGFKLIKNNNWYHIKKEK